MAAVRILVFLLVLHVLTSTDARKLPGQKDPHKKEVDAGKLPNKQTVDKQTKDHTSEIEKDQFLDRLSFSNHSSDNDNLLECAKCPDVVIKTNVVFSCPDQISNHKLNTVLDKPPINKLITTPFSSNSDNVAFTVELSKDKSLSDDVPYTFENVLIDTGDNFYVPLGVFSCPDDDYYVFSWTIHAPEGRVNATLVKDGQDVKPGPLTSEISGSFSGSSSMSSILQCTSGSLVWLKSVGWPDADSCNKIEKEYSSFTAYKVFKADDENASGFTAQLSVNNSFVGDFVFDEELIDIGDDYNSSTGEFTCPADGLYVFIISMHLTTDSTNTIHLYKNGARQYYGPYLRHTQDGSQDSGTSSITRLLECEAGDEVNVFYAGASEFLGQVSSFTGYRLFEPAEEDDLVAFHASLSSNTEFINEEVMDFDVADINYGGFYDPALGRFVCPDNEVYFFSWAVTLISESAYRAGEARLVMGEDVIKSGPRTSELLTGSAGSTSSTQAIVRCEEQRAIALQAVVSDNDTMEFFDRYTNLVGFRLPNI